VRDYLARGLENADLAVVGLRLPDQDELVDDQLEGGVMRRACSLIIFCGIACSGLVAVAQSGEGPRPGPPKRDYHYRPFELSLWPPLNLFHVKNKVIVGTSVNLLYGRSTSVYGLEVGVLMNRELEDFGGVQGAAFINHVKGRAFGIQAAGVANSAERLLGLQVATFSNMTGAEGYGIQVSPICNFNEKGDFWGLQVGSANIGGLMNKARVRGLELALLGNIVSGDFIGLQAGAFLNYATTSPFVVQLAGGLNAVAGPMRGLQVGLMNTVWKDFTGLQIGLANAANHDWGKSTGKVTYTGGRTYREEIITVHRVPMRGAQLSALGNSAAVVQGLQLGAANFAWFETNGVQAGVFNWADKVRGVQIGAVNVCRSLRGIQLGGVNVATKNWLPFMVGINAGW